MARQSRTIDASTRALSHFDRATRVARENDRMARAAASIALPGGYRWQLSAKGSLLNDKQVFEAGSFRERGTARDGSGRDPASDLNRSGTDSPSKTATGGSGWNRAAAMVNASARASREIPDLSRAMNALSRIEHSVDLGKRGGATSDSRKYAGSMVPTDARNRAPAGHEAMRPSFADAGVLGNVRVAPSMRGVMPPRGVSQREFARPSSDVRFSKDGSAGASITVNSSPTVVINAAAGGTMQHDVIGALRAHREELFDQLKRESARRERAQF
jgi:hypothetical protein